MQSLQLCIQHLHGAEACRPRTPPEVPTGKLSFTFNESLDLSAVSPLVVVVCRRA